jgi:dihydroflavonol-4-reductase
MARTILVTGATGLVGSNLCTIATAEGYTVRAMVRADADAEAVGALGADVVRGDITDPDSLAAAAKGVDAVVNLAALIGGTWSKHTPEEFDAVNYRGAVNVLDAARDAGVQRTVLYSTIAVLDWEYTMTERSPIAAIHPTDSGYKRAKRSLYYHAMLRASRGQDVVQIFPGNIYGPAPLVERALVPTSFNAAFLLGLTGQLDEYLDMPLGWVTAEDVVHLTLRAIEVGSIGERYLAFGEMGSACSLADVCNRAAELAGIEHRVRNVPLTADAAKYGTMALYAGKNFADPYFDSTATTEALGYAPTPLDDGLRRTLDWFRDHGRL